MQKIIHAGDVNKFIEVKERDAFIVIDSAKFILGNQKLGPEEQKEFERQENQTPTLQKNCNGSKKCIINVHNGVFRKYKLNLNVDYFIGTCPHAIFVQKHMVDGAAVGKSMSDVAKEKEAFRKHSRFQPSNFMSLFISDKHDSYKPSDLYRKCQFNDRKLLCECEKQKKLWSCTKRRSTYATHSTTSGHLYGLHQKSAVVLRKMDNPPLGVLPNELLTAYSGKLRILPGQVQSLPYSNSMEFVILGTSFFIANFTSAPRSKTFRFGDHSFLTYFRSSCDSITDYLYKNESRFLSASDMLKEPCFGAISFNANYEPQSVYVWNGQKISKFVPKGGIRDVFALTAKGIIGIEITRTSEEAYFSGVGNFFSLENNESDMIASQERRFKWDTERISRVYSFEKPIENFMNPLIASVLSFATGYDYNVTNREDDDDDVSAYNVVEVQSLCGIHNKSICTSPSLLLCEPCSGIFVMNRQTMYIVRNDIKPSIVQRFSKLEDTSFQLMANGTIYEKKGRYFRFDGLGNLFNLNEFPEHDFDMHSKLLFSFYLFGVRPYLFMETVLIYDLPLVGTPQIFTYDTSEFALIIKQNIEAKKSIAFTYDSHESHIIVTGTNVNLSDVVANENWDKAVLVDIFVLNEIIIDTDIDKMGKNAKIRIFARHWYVVKSVKFNLCGANAQNYTDAEDGEDGRVGRPGGSAGHFTGIGVTSTNLGFLTIRALGGNGGRGQDGGKGK